LTQTAGLLFMVVPIMFCIFPVISVVCIAAPIATLRWAPTKPEPRFSLALLPLMLCLGSALWGGFCTDPMLNRSEDCWEIQVSKSFTIIFAAVCVGLIVIYRENRPFFASLFLTQLWLMIVIQELSSMALRNVYF